MDLDFGVYFCGKVIFKNCYFLFFWRFGFWVIYTVFSLCIFLILSTGLWLCYNVGILEIGFWGIVVRRELLCKVGSILWIALLFIMYYWFLKKNYLTSHPFQVVLLDPLGGLIWREPQVIKTQNSKWIDFVDWKYVNTSIDLRSHSENMDVSMNYVTAVSFASSKECTRLRIFYVVFWWTAFLGLF